MDKKTPSSFLRQLLMCEVVRYKCGIKCSLGSPALEAKARETFAAARGLDPETDSVSFLREIKKAYDEIGCVEEFNGYCNQEKIIINEFTLR